MDLQKIRTKIDQIDDQIIKSLGQRIKLLPLLVKYKTLQGLPIFQQTRERDLLMERIKLKKKYGVPVELIKKIFTLIMRESRKMQKRIRDNKHLFLLLFS